MLMNVTICVQAKPPENANFSFNGNTDVNINEEKILDITIDNELLLDSHIKESLLLRKLFRTGKKKYNFQFHDKITVHVRPFTMEVFFQNI